MISIFDMNTIFDDIFSPECAAFLEHLFILLLVLMMMCCVLLALSGGDNH